MPDVNGYVSGTEGYVLVDGLAGPSLPFDEWDLDMGPSGMPQVGNWLTSPFAYHVAGMQNCTLKLKGPQVAGKWTGLRNLGSYVFYLGYYVGVYLTGRFLISLKLSNKFETNPSFEVSGKPQGAFSLVVPA